jgi:hypothetical protein
LSPSPRSRFSLRRALSVVACLGLLSGAVTIAAGPAGAAATNIDFSQCSNKNPTLGNCVWLNGDLNQNNSQWFEGMSVPQRVLVRGVTGGTTHTLQLSHQATKNDAHAYDFLTSYAQASQAHQDFLGTPLVFNDCGDFTGAALTACTSAFGHSSATVDVPDDPYLSAIPAPGTPYQTRINAFEGVYGNRTIQLWGDAPITNVTMSLSHSSGADNADTGGNGERINYNLSWTSASTNVLVQFAAHLAVSTGLAGWGPGVGAASVPGDSNDVGLTMSAFDGQGGGQNMTNPINSNSISASVSAINITKIVPGVTSAQLFDFTFNPPGDNNTAPFTLGDGATQPFPNLNPGSYVVTETGETGFTLGSIVCTSGATVTASIPSGTDAGSVTITLHPNEVVNCTFTNTPNIRVPANEIDITKILEGVNVGPSFGFTVSPAINTTSSFALVGGQTQTFATNVGPGVYTVTEQGGVPGFELAGVDCGPGGVGSVANGTATITIVAQDVADQVVACTFTNRPVAAIRITKTVIGNASGQTFDFTLHPPIGSDTAFGLTNGDTAPFNGLPLGTYTVTETGEAGFTLNNITCDAGGSVDVPSGTATISLTAPGQLVNCTFTNAVTPGSVTIVKDAQPNSSQDFTFTPSAGLNGGVAFLLDDDGNDNNALPHTRTFPVQPGTFTVTEAANSQFDLTSITCNDTDSTGSVPTSTATIRVAPGEHVTCTFTNVKHGVYGNDPAVNPTEHPYDPGTNPGGQNAGDTGQNGGAVTQTGGDPATNVAGTNVAVSPVADPGAGQGSTPQVQGTQGDLPRTGAAIAREALGGLLLIGGGLVLLKFRRRRTSPDTN